MDHTDIMRRCDEITAAMRAKGYPLGYASVSYLGYLEHNRWECVAATVSPHGSQQFGIGRRFDSPGAALAATLSDVWDYLQPTPRGGPTMNLPT